MTEKKDEKPSNIVNFKFESKIDDTTYQATFKVRRISVFGVNEIQMIGNRISLGLSISNPAHALIVQRMASIDYIVEEVLGDGKWFQKGNPKETWDAINDTNVLEALYEEVVKFDEWFRPGNNNGPNKATDEEASNSEPENDTVPANSVGREKPTHEQERGTVSSVVVE